MVARRIAQASFGAGVTTLAGITLASYRFGTPTLEPVIYAAAGNPAVSNNMAPSTALCFVLLGIAVILGSLKGTATK